MTKSLKETDATQAAGDTVATPVSTDWRTLKVRAGADGVVQVDLAQLGPEEWERFFKMLRAVDLRQGVNPTHCLVLNWKCDFRVLRLADKATQTDSDH